MRIEPRDRHDERQLEEGLENLFIPLHMRDGIRSYVLDHLPVGGFLTAVIQNDLSAAASAADVENEIALGRWAKLLYNYAPSACHGSRNRMEAWLKLPMKKTKEI
jgi:hypothetical protein